ncbi:MAG: hypothetical protein ABH951_01710, partial [Patescibacteria group bacterium]
MKTKKTAFLIAIMMVVISFFVPEVVQAQYGGDPNTTQPADGEKTDGGSGGYTLTGFPLEFYGTIRRPFNIGFGVQLSNGTPKHLMTAMADVGINFRGKQFAGIRAMYYPTFWFGVGLSEYITFGQNMDVGQGVPTGDLFGFAFMSKNTFNLE